MAKPGENPAAPPEEDNSYSGYNGYGSIPYAVSRRAEEAKKRSEEAAKNRVAPDFSQEKKNPFNPMDMYVPRGRGPYSGYEPGGEPPSSPSLQAATINPQAALTAMPQPNPGRITGSMYDFLKQQPVDNSELFNMDVAGKTARGRMSGDG